MPQVTKAAPSGAERVFGEMSEGRRIGREAPEYLKYRSGTDREIPVLRLTRR